MNEASPKLSPRDACFNHLVGLTYALAGDLESAAPLDFLLHRWNAIDWNDSSFIRYSEGMRSPMPRLKGAQEIDLQPSSGEMFHLLNERFADFLETHTTTLVGMQQLLEAVGNVRAHTAEVCALNQTMRDHLEMLGADVSAYTLPPDPLK